MTLHKTVLGLATVAGLMTLGSAAFAQGYVVVGQQPPPGYGYAPQPMEVDRGRFRLGWNLSGGGMFAAGASGPAIGIGLRLGWQVNRLFAVYYYGQLPVGFASGNIRDASGRSRSVGGAAIALTNTIAAEVTLANMFHFGLGPSLDQLLGAVCSNDGMTEYCAGSAGTRFGLNARAAISFGAANPARRRAFSIGLDIHPIFTGEAVYTFIMVGVGAEWY